MGPGGICHRLSVDSCGRFTLEGVQPFTLACQFTLHLLQDRLPGFGVWIPSSDEAFDLFPGDTVTPEEGASVEGQAVGLFGIPAVEAENLHCKVGELPVGKAGSGGGIGSAAGNLPEEETAEKGQAEREFDHRSIFPGNRVCALTF